LLRSEHLKLIHGGSKPGALGGKKTCARVFEGHSRVWSEISWRWSSEVARVYKLRLDRQCKKQEEHLRVLL
jgi:hypothetical protein